MSEKTLVLQKENPNETIKRSERSLTSIVTSETSEVLTDEVNESYVVSFYVTTSVSD